MSSPAQFFDQAMAEAYDARNSRLVPISESMHFLIRLVLADLPEDARVLCVGIGTGADILALAQVRPGWTFVGVDPSAEMLEVCRGKLAAAGVADRCELLCGTVGDVSGGAGFDAVLSVLVAHFVADRDGFYRDIRARLKPGGFFVSTEISCDLDAVSFPALLRTWEQVQVLMGAGPDSLSALPDTLRNTLAILPPEATEARLKAAGFGMPVAFFQAFLIRGWFARG